MPPFSHNVAQMLQARESFVVDCVEAEGDVVALDSIKTKAMGRK
jgi:hypothetical protein